MIKLKEIKKNNQTIECDIYPEDSVVAGHIVVDLKDKEITSYTLPKGYEHCDISHISHARKRLVELSKENSFPKEDIVMWY